LEILYPFNKFATEPYLAVAAQYFPKEKIGFSIGLSLLLKVAVKHLQAKS
jgi:hypothetical protein